MPIAFAFGFGAFTIAMRFADHAPNFTPMAALALFSQVQPKRSALTIDVVLQ